jgi:dTDP-4-amino-4,6-dideoxygalactose transaminase
MPDEFVPIARVRITDSERAAVDAVLRSGWLTTGPRTVEFEARCRELIGCAHALALASGTAALHLALSALGLGPGDEVVTTPLTFAATVNAILYVGATPVLADVDPATLSLDPEAAAARVGPRTRAILPVHFGGAPADLDRLHSLCDTRKLALVEDAAQAMGARYRGARVGACARAACFSFHPVKNMTTGEGGLLATSDPEVDRLARLRSWHGIDKNALARYREGGSWRYAVEDLGWKYNFTDIQAALGLGQLERLDAANAERRAIAAEYDRALCDLPEVARAPARPEIEDARQIYWLVLNPDRYDRERFIAAMAERKIATAVHYIPIHLHPYYRRRLGFRDGQCPIAERAFAGLVSVPLFPGMSARERERVIEGIRTATARAAR